MVEIKQKLLLAGLLTLSLLINNVVSAEGPVDEIVELEQRILNACPKQWESLYSNIELNPNVLDVWQGNITDRAQFVQYANEFLLDGNGQLLIDNYSDVVTIMTECGAQRVTYYKKIRQQIGASVGNLVSELTGQTAFSRRPVSGGVNYDDWIDDTTIDNPGVVTLPMNLAIGRPTSQSGTTSEELSNLDPDTEYTDEEYGEIAKRSGYAVRAVDNNLSGDLSKGEVTYTGVQNQPFWQVELDDISKISEIKIYNREDCETTKLNNFAVLVSEKPITKRTLSEARTQDGVSELLHSITFESCGLNKVVPIPEGLKARYLRIQLAGNDTVLSLTEVVVTGLPDK